MLNHIKDLLRSKELLQAWVRRIIRARYQQSVLGAFWAVLQPAATVVIFTVVFTRFVRVDTGGIPYVLFSFTTMVPWTFFSTSLNDMVNSLVENMSLVTKIYFPREVLPLAALLARLLDFGIATGVLLLMMVYYHVPLFSVSWLYLPVILSIQLALALGLGLMGSTLNVFYRDIRHLVALGLQIWLYASPIIYPVSVVPVRLRPLFFMNPMAGVLEAYRAVLLHGRPPDSTLITSAFIALSTLLIGYWLFKRAELHFADAI
ncbi:MAG: ABC transporter permease [Acidobacteria bacterium]|nr:ABC transporter permease [Acidobacteriota bacterium]